MGCLIIGAGLTGAMIARRLADRGETVQIIERRDHVGGNMYDCVNEHSFPVQKYGSHAFCTDDEQPVGYIRCFEEWMPYELRCGAVSAGGFTPMPFNFTTIDTFYPDTEALKPDPRLNL